MIINYKINNEIHNIVISDTIKKNIVSQVEKVKSDKKILLVYDNNINLDIINVIQNEFKIIGVDLVSVRISGKKKNKNYKILLKIIDVLISNQFTKNSILVSCGGGVVGDLSNFAASIYLRGMVYFHIPTTMTAIVDSCIGGKTAINYKNVINSIGTYYHPKSVLIFKEIIDNLPEREYLAGIPEILKCGLIKKTSLLNFIENFHKEIKERKFKILKKVIFETLKVKIYYFKKDIYEKNIRLNLNFGHTFAHAIEMATDKYIKKDFFRHGEAVGLGIMCEIYYSYQKDSKLLNYVKQILDLYKLPTKIICEKNFKDKAKIQSEIYKAIFLDKKKLNRYPRYINMKKKFKPNIKEIKNFNLINLTIKKFLN